MYFVVIIMTIKGIASSSKKEYFNSMYLNVLY